MKSFIKRYAGNWKNKDMSAMECMEMMWASMLILGIMTLILVLIALIVNR